jgi:hypothetical protein
MKFYTDPNYFFDLWRQEMEEKPKKGPLKPKNGKNRKVSSKIVTIIIYWLTCNHDHVASVSRARFVTGGAIDLKLCTYVPLDKSNSNFGSV